jgi:hypothetical protein
MSQTVVSVIESVTKVTVAEQDVTVSITEQPVKITAATTGLQGIQGVPGPGNTLTVGTVTKSSDDTAVVTITGTSPAQTIDFVLPRGLQGIQGIQGERGEVGQTGSVGPKGDTGNTGATGSVGPAGEIGPQGIQGIQGEVGPVGLAGADSTVPGPQGEQGIQGEVGPAGADSTVPGPEGPQGEPGADSTVPGPEGPEGPPGADSTVPGPQGEQGEVGPGVAAGGTEGQVLLKVDGTDYNTIWADNAAESTFYLVRNNTGIQIPKGTLVAAVDAEPSGRIDVAPFEVTGLQDSELRVMGVATANINNGVNGTVMSFGTLRAIDTRGNVASAIAVGDETWAEGDILYAHPTVDGKLTKVRPQHDLAIAFITVRHQSAGQLAVRIIPGNFHLEWLHDVSLNYDTITNNQVLTYSTATSLWTSQTQEITVNGTAVALGGTITVNARLA